MTDAIDKAYCERRNAVSRTNSQRTFAQWTWNRGAIALVVAALVGALSAAPAQAGHYFFNGSGAAIHIHTARPATFNEINQSGDLSNHFDWSRYDWSWKSYAELPRTGHSWVGIHGIDNDYGRTGWSGLSTNNGDRQGFASDSGGHYAHNHNLYNLTYVRDMSGFQRDALTCQELGHALSLNHAAGDCMGYGYFANWNSTQGRHSLDAVNFLFTQFGHTDFYL